MRTIIGRLSVVICGLVLTGCASGPKFADYRASLAAPPPGQGRIWIYRRSAVFGDALEPAVKLDGTKIGDTIPGSFFQVETAPGSHTISTTTETAKDVTVVVSTNADSYIQCYLVPGVFVGHVIPTVMSEPDALRALETMTYAK